MLGTLHGRLLERIGGFPILSIASALLFASVSAPAQHQRALPIPPEYDHLWLLELEPMLLEPERKAYLQLEDAWQRQSFRRAFVQARDPTPRLFLNQAKEALHHNVTAARNYGRAPDDPRSKVILFHGAPSTLIEQGNCAGDDVRFEKRQGKRPERRLLDSDCLLAPAFTLFDYGPEAAVGWAPVLFATDVESYPQSCRLFDTEMRPPVRVLRFTPQACKSPWYDIEQRFNEAKKAHFDWERIRRTGLQVPPQQAWLERLPQLPPVDSPQLRYRVLSIEEAKLVELPTPRDRRDEPEASLREKNLFDATGELAVPVPESWSKSRLPWFNLSYRADVFSTDPKAHDKRGRDAALIHVGRLDGRQLLFRPPPGAAEVPSPSRTAPAERQVRHGRPRRRRSCGALRHRSLRAHDCTGLDVLTASFRVTHGGSGLYRSARAAVSSDRALRRVGNLCPDRRGRNRRYLRTNRLSSRRSAGRLV